MRRQLIVIAVCAVALASAFGCRRRHDVPPESSSGNPGEPLVAAEASPVAAPPAPVDPNANGLVYYPPPAPPTPPVTPTLVDMAPPQLGYARTQMPDGGTVNGDPKGPRAADMNKVLQASMPKFESCLNSSTEIATGTSLKVDVKYTVGNDGKATGVEVTGPVSGKVQACLRAEVEALGYPKFAGPPVPHAFPLNYDRKLQPPPEPAP